MATPSSIREALAGRRISLESDKAVDACAWWDLVVASGLPGADAGAWASKRARVRIRPSFALALAHAGQRLAAQFSLSASEVAELADAALTSTGAGSRVSLAVVEQMSALQVGFESTAPSTATSRPAPTRPGVRSHGASMQKG